MEQRAWTGTGVTQSVPSEYDRIPEFDPCSGDHLWTIFTAYQWGGPGVEQPQLDSENLLAIMGPGCFYCEEVYDERLARRRCKGPAR